MVMERKTGVLMPLFSMRRVGDAGIGDLAALEEWVDWASAHGVGFLQLLPVNALGEDAAPSPYSSISSVALEPLYLTLERIPGMPENIPAYQEDLPPLQLPGGRDLVDYARVRTHKRYWFREAWKRFEQEEEFAPLRDEFLSWVQGQGVWLEDFTTFLVASYGFGTIAWWLWPEQNTDVVRRIVNDCPESREQKRHQQWLQWLCAREWAGVRAHTKSNLKL